MRVTSMEQLAFIGQDALACHKQESHKQEDEAPLEPQAIASKQWEPPTPESILVPVRGHASEECREDMSPLSCPATGGVEHHPSPWLLPPPALAHSHPQPPPPSATSEIPPLTSSQPPHSNGARASQTSKAKATKKGGTGTTLKLVSMARPGTLLRNRRSSTSGGASQSTCPSGQQRSAVEITRATPCTVNSTIAKETKSDSLENPFNSSRSEPPHGFFAEDKPGLQDHWVVLGARPALELQHDASIATITPFVSVSTAQSIHPSPPKKIPLNSSTELSRKRPRREAAIASLNRTALAARQPSPFDLEEDGGRSPSPHVRSSHTAADTTRRISSSSKTTPSSYSTANGGTHSNRKVSHSLIERRRREKINDCLTTLRAIVPQCREEGEKKVARARERGRTRTRTRKGGSGGKGNHKRSWDDQLSADEGEDGGADQDGDERSGVGIGGTGGNGSTRGGLHKLEILQGTILYIEELEAKLSLLKANQDLRAKGSSNPGRRTCSSTAFADFSSPNSSPGSQLKDSYQNDNQQLASSRVYGVARGQKIQSHSPEPRGATNDHHTPLVIDRNSPLASKKAGRSGSSSTSSSFFGLALNPPPPDDQSIYGHEPALNRRSLFKNEDVDDDLSDGTIVENETNLALRSRQTGAKLVGKEEGDGDSGEEEEEEIQHSCLHPVDAADTAAGLLLLTFSTSPELRPVFS